MRAQEYADPRYVTGLLTTGSRFTAGIDGNGSNPGKHGAHWLGMSRDLSVKPYLDAYVMRSQAAELPATITTGTLTAPLPGKNNDFAWSNVAALELAEQLRNELDPVHGNNLMGNALRNLLAACRTFPSPEANMIKS